MIPSTEVVLQMEVKLRITENYSAKYWRTFQIPLEVTDSVSQNGRIDVREIFGSLEIANDGETPPVTSEQVRAALEPLLMGMEWSKCLIGVTEEEDIRKYSVDVVGTYSGINSPEVVDVVDDRG